MSYKIGNYIHAVLKGATPDDDIVAQGTIRDILLDGTIVISDGLQINPETYVVTVFSDVTSLNTAEAAARAEAMKRHPAGKGIRL